MSLGPAPLSYPVTGKEQVTAPWRAWFSSLFNQTQALGTNGSTALRPVATPTVPLYVGQSYFDQTLGVPIWVKSLNPTVWVNATGAPV
jgi:hypothetical protein